VKYYTNKARQAGMTLIELTVVLLVLIGLAGLMIPYVSGFVSKTHDATGSDSLASLNSAIQRYDVQFLGQPSDYDSLMATDLTSGTGYTKLMGGAIEAAAGADKGYLKEVSVLGEVLTSVGIDSLMTMNNSTSDATFAATSGSVGIVKTTTYQLAALNVSTDCSGATAPMGCIASDSELSVILGRPVNTGSNDYLAFGVGQNSGMVGKTISEAPVHFAKTGAMSAANKYNRILAIYEVPNNATVTAGGFCTGAATTVAAGVLATQPATMMLCTDMNGAGVDQGALETNGTWTMVMSPKAKFVTTAMPMMMLEGLGGALASHYSSVDD